MDNSLPLTIALHLDYLPFEVDRDEGWTPREAEAYIKQIMQGELELTEDSLALVEIEIIPQRSTPNA